MKKFKLLMCIALLFSGSAFAQFGDCDSHGIQYVRFQMSDYEDTDSDGCRDGNYADAWFRVSSMLRGSPVTPQGNYFRFLVEIYGSNSNGLSNPVLVHSETLNPETNGAVISTQLQDFRYKVRWNYTQEPVSYKYMFIRLRIQDFRWVSYGFGGEYIGFSSDYCDSGAEYWCPGTGVSPGGGGTPDLKQEGYTELLTDEGTTYIQDVGEVAVLRPGAEFHYKVTCENVGDGNASNFQIETFVTTAQTLPNSAAVPSNAVGSIQFVSTLIPGQSILHNQTDQVDNHTSKFSSSGYRFFHTRFDTQGSVTESDETNNNFTQLAYYFHSGSAGREGAISFTGTFGAGPISFLYQDYDPVLQQLSLAFHGGLNLSVFPAIGPGMLIAPAYQTTIQDQYTTVDLSGLAPGIYRVVLDGTYIKRIAVN